MAILSGEARVALCPGAVSRRCEGLGWEAGGPRQRCRGHGDPGEAEGRPGRVRPLLHLGWAPSRGCRVGQVSWTLGPGACAEAGGEQAGGLAELFPEVPSPRGPQGRSPALPPLTATSAAALCPRRPPMCAGSALGSLGGRGHGGRGSACTRRGHGLQVAPTLSPRRRLPSLAPVQPRLGAGGSGRAGPVTPPRHTCPRDGQPPGGGARGASLVPSTVLRLSQPGQEAVHPPGWIPAAGTPSGAGVRLNPPPGTQVPACVCVHTRTATARPGVPSMGWHRLGSPEIRVL